MSWDLIACLAMKARDREDAAVFPHPTVCVPKPSKGACRWKEMSLLVACHLVAPLAGQMGAVPALVHLVLEKHRQAASAAFQRPQLAEGDLLVHCVAVGQHGRC